jgi:xylulose-5-phosphate/fructose-6-phosphate phosphoketolase
MSKMPYFLSIVNFHGFPSAVKQLLWDRGSPANPSRFTILGYIEQGTTTSPMMMLRMNECCRYDVAIKAVQGVLKEKKTNKIDVNAHSKIADYMHQNRYLEKYAKEHGEDPPAFQQVALYEG